MSVFERSKDNSNHRIINISIVYSISKLWEKKSIILSLQFDFQLKNSSTHMKWNLPTNTCLFLCLFEIIVNYILRSSSPSLQEFNLNHLAAAKSRKVENLNPHKCAYIITIMKGTFHFVLYFPQTYRHNHIFSKVTNISTLYCIHFKKVYWLKSFFHLYYNCHSFKRFKLAVITLDFVSCRVT